MNQIDSQAMYRAVRAHGLRTVIRGCTHLLTVALMMRDEALSEAPGPGAISAYWNQPLRTTDREAAAWRAINPDRGVGEAARELLSSGLLDGRSERDDAAALLTLPYVLG